MNMRVNMRQHEKVRVSPTSARTHRFVPPMENLSIQEDSKHPSISSPEAEQLVTPWDVHGAVVDGVAKPIDYDKLIRQFGVNPITPELIQRFEKVTGKKAH